ncbi:MAG: hypothetical protein AAFR98_03550 [Pseudomonadota bacterium]
MQRSVLMLLVLLMAVSCGPREQEIERSDELIFAEEEEENVARGLFQRDREVDRVRADIIFGELVPEIDSLRLDQTADGVIVVASSRLNGTAAYDVTLRPTNGGFPDEDGFLSFEFRFDVAGGLRPSLSNADVSAAEFVSFAELAPALGIRVFAAQNNRSVRR